MDPGEISSCFFKKRRYLKEPHSASHVIHNSGFLLSGRPQRGGLFPSQKVDNAAEGPAPKETLHVSKSRDDKHDSLS
jgi:hypothetical protein